MFKQRPFLAVVLSIFIHLIFSGCSQQPETSNPSVDYEALRPLLNSERIKLKFGSYGIDVLESDAKTRVSNLYSLKKTQKVCRTFAVVNYPEKIDSMFANEHQAIISGQSIGAVFKQNGWQIEKHHKYFGEIKMKKSFRRINELMGNISSSHLSIHIYVLTVKKTAASFDYATIAEVHHPQYLTLADLSEIYPNTVDRFSKTNHHTQEILEVVFDKMK